MTIGRIFVAALIAWVLNQYLLLFVVSFLYSIINFQNPLFLNVLQAVVFSLTVVIIYEILVRVRKR